MRTVAALIVLTLASSALGQPVNIGGRLEQGGLLVGTAPPGTKVLYEGRTYEAAPSGTFIIGFGRDAPEFADINVLTPDGNAMIHMLDVRARTWAVEQVEGLPQKLVTPDPATERKITEDNKKFAAVRQATVNEGFFERGFIRPAEGRVSGVFGSQRILNGEPRAPHLGLDIAGPIGTPVRAAGDGIVSLAKADMILTGQTVVIEHGSGLDTIYIHMSDIRVKEGQRVKQGDVIGAIGRSGRTNGPHLHFGVTWYDVRLDPETVLAVLPPKP
jgi:murein DD-endopeptidase MepM/ murein hydrolase activator NlpD